MVGCERNAWMGWVPQQRGIMISCARPLYDHHHVGFFVGLRAELLHGDQAC